MNNNYGLTEDEMKKLYRALNLDDDNIQPVSQEEVERIESEKYTAHITPKMDDRQREALEDMLGMSKARCSEFAPVARLRQRAKSKDWVCPHCKVSNGAGAYCSHCGNHRLVSIIEIDAQDIVEHIDELNLKLSASCENAKTALSLINAMLDDHMSAVMRTDMVKIGVLLEDIINGRN